MKPVKIEDLPQSLQAQVRAQLDAYAVPVQGGTSGKVPPLSSSVEPVIKVSGPNKTEADYQRYHLRGQDARYEAISFRMANGLRYTPDWVIFVDGRPVECHECKGAYRMHSHQRARLAWCQCAKEFPGLKWVWATKTTEGWRIEHA